MSKKSTSLVKSTSAISSVDPIVIINTITDAINTVSKTIDKYLDYQIVKEETEKLRIQNRNDDKKAKLQLKALSKSLDFNIKYINKQAKESQMHIESILKQNNSSAELCRYFLDKYFEMIKLGTKQEELNSIWGSITIILNTINELNKNLRPANFSTINM